MADESDGHWVTIDEHPVFITGGAGTIADHRVGEPGWKKDRAKSIHEAMGKAESRSVRVRTSEGEQRFSVGPHGDAEAVAAKAARAEGVARVAGTHVATEHRVGGEFRKIKLSRTFYLSSTPPNAQPGQMGSTLIAANPADMPREINGQPAKYFWGRGLKIGSKYYHPIKGWELNTTPQLAENLIENFNAMTADGNRVPIVDDHVATQAKSLGWVVGLRKHDGWLEPLMQFIGDDAIRQAARNEISVGIEPFTDGTGREYGLSLVHVAITPYPVVPGQDGLRAASRGQEAEAPVIFHLAATPTKGAPMHTVQVSPEHMATMRRMCDMSEGDPDDMAMSRFVEKHKALSAAHKETADGLASLTEQHKKLTDDHAKLLARHTEAEKHLSRAGGAPPADPEVLHERSLRIGDKFDSLVGNGYSAADVEKLKSVILGTTEAPNVFSLSRATGAKDCNAALIVDVLRECKPAPRAGEKSGQQQMHLARPQDAVEPPPAKKVNPLLDEAKAMFVKA